MDPKTIGDHGEVPLIATTIYERGSRNLLRMKSDQNKKCLGWTNAKKKAKYANETLFEAQNGTFSSWNMSKKYCISKMTLRTFAVNHISTIFFRKLREKNYHNYFFFSFGIALVILPTFFVVD